MKKRKVLYDVFSCELFSAVCPLHHFCRHGARGELKEDLGGEGKDKEVGFTSLELRE